ncbi:MAG: DUF5104 domain-containing protein [Clostridia bacterium]|nr:DUF5104 domain-containing protein [Clostridia bacterium]
MRVLSASGRRNDISAKNRCFFNALDKGDSDEIKSLFSRTVLSSDSDLDEQIDKLISIYPRSTTAIMFDGLLGGEYADDAGMYKSMAYATFPVVSNNRYFWVYIELIYEDDFSSDNIGLNRVFFYTADEYCTFIRDENTTYPFGYMRNKSWKRKSDASMLYHMNLLL